MKFSLLLNISLLIKWQEKFAFDHFSDGRKRLTQRQRDKNDLTVDGTCLHWIAPCSSICQNTENSEIWSPILNLLFTSSFQLRFVRWKQNNISYYVHMQRPFIYAFWYSLTHSLPVWLYLHWLNTENTSVPRRIRASPKRGATLKKGCIVDEGTRSGVKLNLQILSILGAENVFT